MVEKVETGITTFSRPRLDTLPDVLITTKANKDGLYYDVATGLWKNRTLPQSQLDLCGAYTHFRLVGGDFSSQSVVGTGNASSYYEGPDGKGISTGTTTGSSARASTGNIRGLGAGEGDANNATCWVNPILICFAYRIALFDANTVACFNISEAQVGILANRGFGVTCIHGVLYLDSYGAGGAGQVSTGGGVINYADRLAILFVPTVGLYLFRNGVKIAEQLTANLIPAGIVSAAYYANCYVANGAGIINNTQIVLGVSIFRG